MAVERINAPVPLPGSAARPVPSGKGPSFREVLDGAARAQDLKFSAHARRRLEERRIDLSPAELAKIREAVDLAAAKGARDSLLIYRDLALVASVTNRTVITAVDGSEGTERVFTNIDSAVIIK